jgi:hypothetical protein
MMKFCQEVEGSRKRCCFAVEQHHSLLTQYVYFARPNRPKLLQRSFVVDPAMRHMPRATEQACAIQRLSSSELLLLLLVQPQVVTHQYRLIRNEQSL